MVANARKRLTHPAIDGGRECDLSAAVLAAALLVVLALPQVVLWHFLGLVPAPAGFIAAGAIVSMGWLVVRKGGRLQLVRVSPGQMSACFCLACALILLGGEGRLFYAVPDWQVRGAVLRDLVVYPWPWSYHVGGQDTVLRAPLGMYLLPGLAGKTIGERGAEWVLAAQNSAVLTILLAIGGQLFPSGRARWTAFAIFIGFSGMDIVGTLLAGKPVTEHLEGWNGAQFSSHITQLFWVPQHCLVGWTEALLFLMWRRSLISLAALLTPLPLLALWSPLALLGIMPFAAYAAMHALVERKLRPSDILLPLGSLLVALPSLLYLAADSGAVGSGAVPLPVNRWLALELLEVVPLLLAATILRPRSPFGGPTLALVAAVLLTVPFGQIGSSADFGMRASIPALALLALAVADVLTRATDQARTLWRMVLVFVLVVGAATPISEIARALALPPAPKALCSYYGVVPGGASTYVAPVASLSPFIAPAHATRVIAGDPTSCWDGPWPPA